MQCSAPLTNSGFLSAMAGLTKQRIILFSISLCLCFTLGHAQDVSFINSTDSLCNGGEITGRPSNITVINVESTSADVRWEVEFVLSESVVGFEVLYWPASTTTYQSVSITRRDVRGTTLLKLTPYTDYLVAVRSFCGNKLSSVASSPALFTTGSAAPNGSVSNVSVTVASGSGFQVNISWLPLPDHLWNGKPYGYYIQISRYSRESMCGGDPIQRERNTQEYPANSLVYSISVDGCYRVIVFPTNSRHVGPSSEPLFFTFTKFPLSLATLSVSEIPTPPAKEGPPFLKSPYVYIIVLVVVAVVPIVMGIVLFKKAMEKRRNKVQYCRDIDEAVYSGVNFQALSPLSSALPSPPPTASMHGASRGPQPFPPIGPGSLPPLPYPKMEPPDYAEAQPYPAVFGMGPTRLPQDAKPHPLHLPRSAEGGVPMVRSHTLEQSPRSEIFSGGQKEQRQGRQRALTEGGMPSPYENPVNGGSSTLPRGDFSKQSHAGDEGGPIPPPPSHAPPPLTQSSLEIFARMRRSPQGGHPHHQEMEQMHGMSHRSYSTTNTECPTSPTGNPMRTIKSTGQLHSLEAMPEESALPFRQFVGSSSNGHSSGEKRSATLDRKLPYPPQHSMPHSPPAHTNLPLQQPQYFSGGSVVTNNSDNYSSYSEITDTGSVSFTAGRRPGHAHVSHHHNHPASEKGGGSGGSVGGYNTTQRESVFSETSTEEPSISSGSIRGASPSAAPSWVNGSIDPRRSLSPGTPSTDVRTLRGEAQTPPISPP